MGDDILCSFDCLNNSQNFVLEIEKSEEKKRISLKSKAGFQI